MQLETLPIETVNRLKKKTKKQIVELQSLKGQEGSTTLSTCTVLGFGVINYFFHPTLCAVFVSSYLLLLQADLMKSMFVMKYGNDPLWQWKMKDCAYLINSTFGFLTCLVLARHGLARLK